jgi:tetratricopeptide (TPR) repeat protein
MPGLRLCLVTALAVASACAANLELRGRTDPPLDRASVSLHGVNSPYAATALGDAQGRFRFKNLVPGAYDVILFAPGYGEFRRTVDVTPSVADKEGRVSVTIPVARLGESGVQRLEDYGTVSVRELKVPGAARSEYDKAQTRLSRRDVDGAIKYLLRAVEIAPQFVEAWNNLGTIAYRSGEYDKAEKYFREALQHDPGSFWPVVNLGGTLLSLRRYEDALPYNRHAVTERPGDALANAQTGSNYYSLGDDELALKYLNEAKRIDAGHFSYPQIFLAEVYARRGQPAKAILELEDFLARHPDSRIAGEARQRLETLRKGQGR